MLCKKSPVILLVLFSITLANAQIRVPFDTVKWDIRAQDYQLTEYKGQKSLFMKGGIALLEDAQFENGIIEWDMAFPAQRGFAGVRFRIEDLRNFEEFYFRPHQSGQPDANQYCPVDNGLATWQLYYGEAYSVPYEYNFDEWFHVKLVVAGTRAEVYVDDMRNPILHIPFLKRKPRAGGLMVYSGLVPVHFANFSYMPMKDQPALVNPPVPEKAMDPLVVPQWSISNPFPATWLENMHELDKMDQKTWEWQPLLAEPSGTANLAAVSDFDRTERNTVFAKMTVESSRDQIKGLQIGFSDRAKVYCNGQLLFSGNDSYQTRDYRYLGTIGYFDTVYLPLKKGKNEVWIAVSEGFGGWGIQGQWEDLEGISVK